MKPAPPSSCFTSRSPGARSGFSVSLTSGSFTSVGSPVSVSTLRPSFDEKKRIVMPFDPADAEISTAASQSLRKISSGPPKDTVASRPFG